MIIGLTGKKQAGKDTVAEYLTEEHGYVRRGFADPLKEAVANLFGIGIEHVDAWKNDPDRVVLLALEEESNLSYTEIKAFTWRNFLQRFGTEMGRNTFGHDFWVELGMNNVDVEDKIVFSDVRFPNEALAIHRKQGIVVEIIRPGHTDDDTHASEQGINTVDARVINYGTYEELYIEVDFMLSYAEKVRW